MSDLASCCCTSCCSDTSNNLVDSHIEDSGIASVSTILSGSDIWGAIKVRLGIGRDSYMVAPGLYRLGNPDGDSPVLVTANYKLTFDTLRSKLAGITAWILVLDTKGINVWCAAGKGTFGTEEVIARVASSNLADIVSHRTLILPQLGAPGVAAHEVAARTGFRIIYGPIRAVDIAAFLNAGMKVTPEMRKVQFKLLDRIVLIPIEFAHIIRPLLLVLGTLFAALLLGVADVDWTGTLPYFGAVVVGLFLVPALLPWIPMRAFAFKGWLVGVLFAVLMILMSGSDLRQAILYLCILPAIAGYLAFRFTGSSTYASPSGVAKEMRYALPAFGGSILLGLVYALSTC